MKRVRLKHRDIVRILFQDHCKVRYANGIQDRELMVFELFGRLVAETKKSYMVAAWIETNGSLDHNTETYTIAKSTVLGIRRLR